MNSQLQPVPEGRAQCSWREHPGGLRCLARSAHMALQKPLATSTGSKVLPRLGLCGDWRDCSHRTLPPAVGPWWQGPQSSRSREGPAVQAPGLRCWEGWSQSHWRLLNSWGLD